MSASQPGKPCDDEGLLGQRHRLQTEGESAGQWGLRPILGQRQETGGGGCSFVGTAGGAGRRGPAAGRAGDSGVCGQGLDHGDALPKGKQKPLKGVKAGGPFSSPREEQTGEGQR